MDGMYFNPANCGFIPEAWTRDGTYDGAPKGAVLLTDEERETYHGANPPDGMMLGAVNGRPAWVEQPPATREQVQAIRLGAYRLESDPLKIEAEYDAQVSGAAPDYSAWIAKVEEIKARYPFPEQA